MVKTITYCDHCGKEINTMNDFCDIEINLHSSWFDTDLCSDCYDELEHIAKQFCNKEE